MAGWHLPGGGVETGETVHEALARELMEEGGITALEPPVLHGVFFNARVSRRDHVAVFVVRDFRAGGRAAPRPRDHRPRVLLRRTRCRADTTRGTRARLAEVLEGAPRSERW